MRFCRNATLVCSLLALTSALNAADWPQFLGPNRNGISTETGLLESWPKDGPKEVWRVPGGVGMTGVTIRQGRAITMVQTDGRQRMTALDVKTGKTLWQADLAPAYKNQMGDGPRSTPTLAGDEAFVLTGEGKLAAVSLTDGKILWNNDALGQLRGEIADYGMACSSLLVGENVIVSLGAPKAAVAAFERKSGKLVWQADSDPAGYSSPALLKIAGKEQVVVFTGGAAVGLSPEKGEVLWRFPYATDFGCNIATPLEFRGKVFISAGENHGCALLSLTPVATGFDVAEAWSSLGPKSVMRNEWQTSIVLGEHLYGFDNVGGAGPVSHLACIHLPTGKATWQKARFGKGNMIWADGKAFISTLNGELILATLDPGGYQELGRKEVVGKTRQAPALADGLLFLRDDKEIVCLDVRKP